MKVLIADGHWATRTGLVHCLATRYPGVSLAEAATLPEALGRLEREGPFDLCLFDFTLSTDGYTGEEPARRRRADPGETMIALRHLHEAAPALPILVVSGHESRRIALEALDAGASGFIGKSAPEEALARAVARVLAGEISLPAGLNTLSGAEGVADARAPFHHAGAAKLDSTAASRALNTLTPRQQDVLSLIARGKRNAEIAERLRISPRTVQIHVSTILRHLGVGNRTEAALLARGLGDGDD